MGSTSVAATSAWASFVSCVMRWSATGYKLLWYSLVLNLGQEELQAVLVEGNAVVVFF